MFFGKYALFLFSFIYLSRQPCRNILTQHLARLPFYSGQVIKWSDDFLQSLYFLKQSSIENINK